MSERLSDEELADVAARVVSQKCHMCSGKGYRAGDGAFFDCVTCSGTGAFALSTQTMVAIIAELRSLRAAAITAEEREALDWARAVVIADEREKGNTPQGQRALTVLERLVKP